MTELYLIRHAEAEGNVFRRFHGQYDSLLMPRGYRQREFLQKRFENIRVDGCFSSDLIRTSLTAGSIYLPKGLKLQRDRRFREVSMGTWEDISYGYLNTNFPEDMDRFSHDPKSWQVLGSERYSDYTDRFITGMTEAARQYDGGTVCIFCHGAVLRGTLMRLFFRDDASQLPFGDNTAVCHLYYDRGQFTYEYLNDASHIPPELSTYTIQKWWRSTGNRKEADLYFQPCFQERGRRYEAWLYSGPVGSVTLGEQHGSTGIILEMTLDEKMQGRNYSDQMLGCAFSHFRRLGCRSLQALPGDYPEQVLQRYGFDPENLSRSIDTTCFEF